jgi:NADH-quinone oxidoreductase subunit N
MGPATDAWRQIIIFMSLASIVLGAVAAIGQTNIKRLLAYSSINNVGFALIGLAAGTPEGVSAVLIYMTVYIAMTLGSFLCIVRMRDLEGAPIESIAALSGLSRSRPALAAALAMFMFSLAGIPPLFGFYPKLAVFGAATNEGLFWLATAGAVGSVVGAYYYLKIVKTMYFDEPAAPLAASDDMLEGGLIAISAVIISPLGYLAIPMLSAATLAAAKALF